MNAAIRPLRPDAHDAIVRHFTSLTAEDRFLRFGAVLDDDALWRYAATIDFGREKVFGLLEDDNRLVGFAHLQIDWRRDTSWAGITVSPGSRCRGYGYALLCVVALEARRMGRRRLAMPSLAENRVMHHLARKAGLSVIDDFGRPGAYLSLGEPTVSVPRLPQHPPAGRRLRAMLVGALLPIFGLDMALMIGAAAACDSCKPQTAIVQR